ncbi:MAG: hypothetical protein Fur005_37360 [Roseiflexaceae bacterium]
MFSKEKQTALFIGLFGLLFVAIGVGVGLIGSGGILEAAAKVEALPVIRSAGGFEDQAIGREVLIEGQVGPENEIILRQYVAYARDEYRGTDEDGDAIWREDERITPALEITLSDGIVRLANEDYTLVGPLTRWQEPGGLIWNGMTNDGTKRYDGIEVGSTVTTVGLVEQGSEGPELAARFVAGGDRSAYLAEQRRGAEVSRIVGAIMGGIGILFMLIGLFIMLRSR